MQPEYCRPTPDGNSYQGWHMKALRKYDTAEQAQAAAEKYGKGTFYCEYGRCWHLKSI